MTPKIRDRRRGRRVLTGTVVLFVVINFAGGLLLDYRWPEVRFPEIGQVFHDLNALGRAPDVVVMGSSRFLGGVRPEFVDPVLAEEAWDAPRTFNAAVTGGDPLVHDRLVQGMLQEGRRPGLLLVEVSPEHFTVHSPLLGQQVLRLMTWTDLPRYLPEAARYSPVRQLVTSRLLPTYTHRYQIRKRLLGGQHAAVVRTWDGGEAKLVLEQSEPLKPSARLVRWFQDYRLSRLTTAALERLLDRCKTAGVPVVLVGAPEATCNRRLVTPAAEAAYLGYVHRLGERYGCRFVDLRDRIPDDGFHDEMHLNGQGAAEFSRAIALDAVLPAWRETHDRVAAFE
jgi:hypothetical protein